MLNAKFLFNIINFNLNYNHACMQENSGFLMELLCPPWDLCSNSESAVSVEQLTTTFLIDPIFLKA